MESSNRGEHVIVAFLDVEKAFDNVWHNGLRYKIYQLDLPTKLCRWLSDFLQGDHIFEKINSLSFPGYFKLFPEQLKREKFYGVHFCCQSCHIFFIFSEFSKFFPQKFKFPRVIPEILTIFQIP